MPDATAGSPHGLGGRLPLIAVDDFDPDQRAFYEQLQSAFDDNHRRGFVATDDQGRAIGPYNAFVEACHAAPTVRITTSRTRSDSEVPERSAALHCAYPAPSRGRWYETYAHSAWARSVGVIARRHHRTSETSVIDTINEDRDDTSLAADELLAYRFTRELVRAHVVTPGTYAETCERFRGRRGGGHGAPHRALPRHVRVPERLRGARAQAGLSRPATHVRHRRHHSTVEIGP